jgi:hypothetical protein
MVCLCGRGRPRPRLLTLMGAAWDKDKLDNVKVKGGGQS